MRFIRTIITSVFEGVLKRFSGTGRPGESFNNRMVFQHFGFSSTPPPGSQGITLVDGNNIVLISSDNPDRRPTLDPDGESVLYIDQNNYVWIKKDGKIEVVSEKEVKTTVGASSTIIKETGEIEANSLLKILSTVLTNFIEISPTLINITGINVNINSLTTTIISPVVNISGTVNITGALFVNGNPIT